jgi:acyl-homoserine lactone acylase PvdQ
MADSRSSHDPDNAAAVSALAELFRNRPPPPPAAGSKGDSQSSEGGLLARFGPLGWRSLWKDVLGASNNWVIAGQHTTTGKPLLANDPHLAFSAPSVWCARTGFCADYGAACD